MFFLVFIDILYFFYIWAMRKIDRFVVHCTDTSSDAKLSAILRYWKDTLGWDMPGYHFIITAKGECIQLADVELIVNGAKGFNSNSLHFAYIGRYPNDTQFSILREEINFWRDIYRDVDVVGHRDLPGVTKSCPNFNVHDWYWYAKLHR